MNTTREQRLLEGQRTNAQQLYEYVPIKEAWTVNQITQAFKQHKKNIEPRIVHGCLRSLEEAKLIKQPKPGLYQRTETRKRQPVKLNGTEKPTIVVNNKSPSKKEDLSTRMTNVLDGMEALSTMAKELSDELESIMINIQETIEEARVKAERFDRLQQLLKD